MFVTFVFSGTKIVIYTACALALGGCMSLMVVDTAFQNHSCERVVRRRRRKKVFKNDDLAYFPENRKG